MVEANLADPWVAATLAPWEAEETLRTLLARLHAASPVPVSIKLPERCAMRYARIGSECAAAGVRVMVVRNDFTGLERLLLETGRELEVIAVGGINSGYDVLRAIGKGAKAVQVGSALVAEGPGMFSRLEREMRIARRGVTS
jgi:dihydroorotate dehydrogenase